MNEKLQKTVYEKYKRRRRVLGWVFPVLIVGKALLMHFDLDEVLEVYTPVMWVIICMVFLYHMYYVYKFRHEDDNKIKLAMALFGIAGLIALVVFT